MSINGRNDDMIVATAYCEHRQYLEMAIDISAKSLVYGSGQMKIPGPPNTRMSSLVDPPLSLIGMT